MSLNDELLPPEPPQTRRLLAPRNIRMIRPPVSKPFSEVEVIVGVTVHNNAGSIRRCLQSILDQQTEPFSVATLILDDSSTDSWMDISSDLLEKIDACVICANCGSPASARNAILDYIAASFPAIKWVARLDADDRLSTSNSLKSMCALAFSTNAEFVIGGNRLVRNGVLIPKTNPATQSLFSNLFLTELLRQMADGTAKNELPSCNLMLSPGTDWRYPESVSAEDHWLITWLLIHHSDRGAILESGFYCDYSLDGSATIANKKSGTAKLSRIRLYETAQKWIAADSGSKKLLGYGRESTIFLVDGNVEKHFFSWPITDDQVGGLQRLLKGCAPFIPEPSWEKRNDCWVATYPYEDTTEAQDITALEAKEFLTFCLNHHIVCKNIKRPNLRRRRKGGLMYIDIGESIMPMDVDYFRDSAARLYAISILGWQDDELRRRPSKRRQTDILRDIDGFEQFYAEIVGNIAAKLWDSPKNRYFQIMGEPAQEVSLMIKICPMDANIVRDQVRHIIAQLERPRPFKEKILLIDPYEGPYLRAYAPGDLPRLMAEVKSLEEAGIVDRVLVSPIDSETIEKVNKTWFNVQCGNTHNVQGVPLVPQLWGFDQVQTRYLLQCDIDILIGRVDHDHDYIAEMIKAVQPVDVLGIAFNIPHAPESPQKPYAAKPGDYVPEVRCGLLDLVRLRSHRPYPNSIRDDKMETSWYRSVQKYQQMHGLKTLRGGDPKTFYVHATKEHKMNSKLFCQVRDLVGQGRVPPIQYEQWDLQGREDDWIYPKRTEDIVFLLRGRNTPITKIKRCISSLQAQSDQNFGVIVIDDASGPNHCASLIQEFRPLWSRTTLICNNSHQGYIPNTIKAVQEICCKPETLVVILDQDDALMNTETVKLLKDKHSKGHDVVLAAMYRPDKPLKVYHPDFDQPRDHYGGEVWIHLRAFQKGLFERLPMDALKIDGQWIPDCEDYAIMIPLVELATSPVHIPIYLYYHERSTLSNTESRRHKDAIIRAILEKGHIGRFQKRNKT